SVKVKASAVGTIPLAEVSGLAHGSGPGGSLVLIAIGDRAGAVAWASTELGTSGGPWETVELGSASGTRIEDGAAQIEAVATDGAGGVLLVQEAPTRAEFVAAAEPFDGTFSAEVVVRVTGLADKPEGLVVLPDGDVLIACDMRASDEENLFLVASEEWTSGT
ncbi:MAG TPA: hypothetical protein VLR88_04990, partial [Propionibacteriaceae bacterium]|nr:hypothetical protein [Propionibacteriaceae bacterium]